jgi:hypothetical protein
MTMVVVAVMVVTLAIEIAPVAILIHRHGKLQRLIIRRYRVYPKEW